jgi:hypothetical protein
MLAARERAAGGAARAALLRRPDETLPTAGAATAGPATAAPAPVSEIKVPTAPAATSSVSQPPVAPPSAEAAEMDTLARLREAKRRARGG